MARRADPYRHLLTVHLDVQQTARYSRHIVDNRQGTVVYQGRSLAEIVHWLDNMEITEFLIEADGAFWHVRLEPVVTAQVRPSWQRPPPHF